MIFELLIYRKLFNMKIHGPPIETILCPTLRTCHVIRYDNQLCNQLRHFMAMGGPWLYIIL